MVVVRLTNNYTMKKSELRETTDSRAYRLFTTIDQDPYRDECWKTHYRKGNFRVKQQGSKNTHCWKRKTIYNFQYRMYRSWKYNRKTKWK